LGEVQALISADNQAFVIGMINYAQIGIPFLNMDKICFCFVGGTIIYNNALKGGYVLNVGID